MTSRYCRMMTKSMTHAKTPTDKLSILGTLNAPKIPAKSQLLPKNASETRHIIRVNSPVIENTSSRLLPMPSKLHPLSNAAMTVKKREKLNAYMKNI